VPCTWPTRISTVSGALINPKNGQNFPLAAEKT